MDTLRGHLHMIYLLLVWMYSVITIDCVLHAWLLKTSLELLDMHIIYCTHCGVYFVSWLTIQTTHAKKKHWRQSFQYQFEKKYEWNELISCDFLILLFRILVRSKQVNYLLECNRSGRDNLLLCQAMFCFPNISHWFTMCCH